MAFDEASLAMRDSTALPNFPSRLAGSPSVRGSSTSSAVADEVNAQFLGSRQQHNQNSSWGPAQGASQSTVNGGGFSVISGQPSACKRPREQAAASPTVATSEAGHHHPKLARIGTEQHLQPHHQQNFLQFHQQQQQGVEQEQQPMEFMGTEDMGVDFSKEFLSSNGAELDTEVAPPPPRPREIFFADFF